MCAPGEGGVCSGRGVSGPGGSSMPGVGGVWSGVSSMLGGVCSRGVSGLGDVWQGEPPHAGRTPPPVNRMTDRCKNITFAKTSFRLVKIHCYYRLQRSCEGYVFTGVCPWGGLGGVWWWYPSMPCRFPGPHPRGKFRGIWLGGSPGPHRRGKFRGIWLGGVSRPTPKGEVRGSGPGPQPRGKLGGSGQEGACSHGGACARGCLLGGVVETPHQQTAAVVDGTHPTGMHSYYKKAFQ